MPTATGPDPSSRCYLMSHQHGAWDRSLARPAKRAPHRLDALGLQRGGRRRRAEERDQRLGRRRLLGRRAQAGGKANVRLQFRGDRPDPIDTGNVRDARRHHHHHVGFAARHHLDGVFGFHRLELGLHRVLDAHAVEQADKVNAAGALARIGHRFRGQQRLLEGLDRRDIGLGRACAHRHAQASTAKVDARTDDRAVLDQGVDDRRIADDHVEALAGFDLLFDLGIHPEAQIDLGAGGAFELRAQLAHRGPRAIAAQDFELGGLRARRCEQQRGGKNGSERGSKWLHRIHPCCCCRRRRKDAAFFCYGQR